MFLTTWIKIHWHNIRLRARSHMTSHYLEDLWAHYMILEMSWDNLWTLSSGLPKFHGHGSWLVCEVALTFHDDTFTSHFTHETEGPWPLHFRELLLVDKAEQVQVRFTIRLRDQRSKWMQDECKVYMASNGSRFTITWTMKKEIPSFWGRPNIKLGDPDTPKFQNHWFITPSISK